MSKDIATCIVQALKDDYICVSHRKNRLQDTMLCQTPNYHYLRYNQQHVIPTALTENERKDILYYRLLDTPYNTLARDIFSTHHMQSNYVEYDVYTCINFNPNGMTLMIDIKPIFKMRLDIGTDDVYLMKYMHELGFVIIVCNSFDDRVPYLYPISKIVNFDTAKSAYDNKW